MPDPTQTKPTAVIVPVYKTDLDRYEQISLAQCVRILSAHPIYLVIPSRLDVSQLLRKYPNLRIKSFDDRYFKSVAGYNELLCSEHFYEAFAEFDYMLICQLDAFVFRDELNDWCARGYDYVGAPQFGDVVPAVAEPKSLRVRLAEYLRQPLLNGGLSLRNVAACLRLLRTYHRFLPRWHGNEDGFFSLHFPRFLPFRSLMNLPEPIEALAFAMELEPQRSIQLNGGKLPMGCHAWFLYDLDHWRPFIQEYGYDI